MWKHEVKSVFEHHFEPNFIIIKYVKILKLKYILCKKKLLRLKKAECKYSII